MKQQPKRREASGGDGLPPLMMADQKGEHKMCTGEWMNAVKDLDEKKIREYAEFYAENYPEWDSHEVATDLRECYNRGEESYLNEMPLEDVIIFINDVSATFERLLFLAGYDQEKRV